MTQPESLASECQARLWCVALITDNQNRILLTRRGKGADAARWGLPSGSVGRMEPAVLAIVRVLHQTLGLLIWPHRIVAVSDEIDQVTDVSRFSVIYSATIVSGEPKIFDTMAMCEFGWFKRSALPTLLTAATIDAIESRNCILADAQSRTENGGQ
ncbi:ADP-ribose pyrophosphatase [Mesorhizobium australicum WSM2073]|uniref:ADP-ribose pyrophosphatase n=1 Tax=Mesorhizobium australicum (strain HAMBI 3006 / LMG 24608 / WSM2073) TaxID=754035 RepID=L0KH98_MESAW|nr:ADP-ribose pyrophosphatase [Mesorhizobium australicum WSM2073]